MAKYPSGISRNLPEPTADRAAWRNQLAFAIDNQPLGQSAACLNPECTQPVDYIAATGPPLLYCSRYCCNRAATLRQRITQQLQVIDTALSQTNARGISRDDLRERARHLRWWLTRLTPSRSD